ncbi:MAG: hypothetical protein OXQ31_04285 [Spirochaetaceae bacterium]|nr:hypothetical protein [Spirochaetaceae bacterium]
MDDRRLALLRRDLQDQWDIIDRVFAKIADRSVGASPSAVQVEALAYQLHNLYGACEQLFELIARAFENQIDGPTYHVDLLRRMKAEIAGVRPALLTEGLAGSLNELRGFRHFFRHAYDSELHSGRVTALSATTLALRPELRDSLDRFIARLQAG